MTRPPLDTAPFVRLFLEHWDRSGKDLDACIAAVVEAARLGITAAELRRRTEARAINRHRPRAIPLHTRPRKLKAAAPILERYAAAVGLTVADLKGARGTAALCAHRRRAAWLLRVASAPRLSFPEVGLLLGRNHAPVLRSVRAVEAEIAARPALRDELLALVGVGGVGVAAGERMAA